MSDSCKCFDIEAEVILDEPEFDGELDFSGEIITCSDGEDYKRGYEEGHAQGLVDGQADGYKKGYDEGHKVGSESGYSQGKQDGLTEGYNNGYEKGKSDGYEQGYSEGYTKGYEQGKAEGSEFIGVKYSDFDNTTGSNYYLPTAADARSLEKGMLDDNSKEVILSSLFYNGYSNEKGGYNVKLKEVYLPNGATRMASTFINCFRLTTIHGDLSQVLELADTFYNCHSLTKQPYTPNLRTMGNRSFGNCTGLTSITFYKPLTTWHTGALTGCTNIETINLVDGWNISVYAQHCSNLTQACLHDMCEKFADMTGKTPLVFKIGEKNIAKIDDEHIAMLQQKNIDYS